MCKHHHKQNKDKCMKGLIKFIKDKTRFDPIMSCCGHGRYAPSLIVRDPAVAEFSRCPFDIFSGVQFKHNQKKFYKKDKDGYYFIPEIINNGKK